MLSYNNEVLFRINNTLLKNTDRLNQCIEKLSTGMQINAPKDNAANYNIMTDLSIQLSSLDVVEDNISNGMDYLNTSSNLLEQTLHILSRIKDLALAASNEIYGADSLSAIQQEINHCVDQISQIQTSADYNDIKLFQNILQLDKSASYIDSNGVLEKLPDTPAVTMFALNNVSDTMNDATNEIIPTLTRSIALKSMMLNTMEVAAAAAEPEPEEPVVDNTISLQIGETKTIDIGDYSFSFTNTSTTANNITYIYDDATKTITLNGGKYNLTSLSAEDHNIVINGTEKIVADLGNGDNNVIVNTGKNISIKANNGTNNIVSNVALNLNLGNGNNTITLNAKNNQVQLGSGQNTINVNAASTYITSSGSDTINKSNGTIVSYNNLYITNGTSATIKNNASNIEFCSDNIGAETTQNTTSNIVLTGNNITYKDLLGTSNIVSNGNNNSINLGNNNNNVIEINGSNSTLATGNGNNTIDVGGNGNRVTTGSGTDTVTVNGTNATINTGDKDDTITVENGANNNIVNGGNGNDTLNQKNNTTSSSGFETINITLDKNTNNQFHIDANKLTTVNMNGKEYTFLSTSAQTIGAIVDDNGYLELSMNNTTVNLQENEDQKVKIVGNNNTYNGTDAKNDVLVNGNNNIINSKDANDTIKIESGSNNTINSNAGDDTIISNGNNNNILGNGGDDNITINGTNDASHTVNGGAGSDEIIVNGSNNQGVITGGDDNDTITINGTGNQNVQGGSGNDTLNQNNNISSTTGFETINITLDKNTNNQFHIDANVLTTVNMNGKEYTFLSTSAQTIGAIVDDNGYLQLSMSNTTVDLKTNEDQKIKIVGNSNTLNGTDAKNDIIVSGNSNTINGKASSDNIQILSGSSNTINGGAGNDTIDVGGSNSTVNLGNGNNQVNVTGNSNYIYSGTGTNNISLVGNTNVVNYNKQTTTKTIVTDTGTNNAQVNINNGTQSVMPNSGVLKFKAGESFDITLGGKTYTISNTMSKTGTLTYSYNPATDTITFEGIKKDNYVESGTTKNDGETLNITAKSGQADKVILNGSFGTVNLGDGNDHVTSSLNKGQIYTGAGDDTLIITDGQSSNAGKLANLIRYYTEAGEDYIESRDNAQYFRVYAGNDNDTIILNKAIGITAYGDGGNDYIESSAQSVSSTYNYLYGGANDDTIITNNTYHYIYGDAGNDNITINSKDGNVNTLSYCPTYGGAGNDTITVNGRNASVIYGEAGNDTFNINAQTSSVLGGDNDDTFNVDPTVTSNKITILDGGAGTDTLNATNPNSYYKLNIEHYEDKLPNSATISITGSGTQILDFGDYKYTIKNNSTSSNNISYSFNTTTKAITFSSANNFEITAAEGQKDNITLNYCNNCIVNAKDEDDTINVGGNNQGTYNNNTINAGDGNDTITSYYKNTNINGEDGNDTINLKNQTNYTISNAATHTVDGGNGTDTINVETSGNLGTISGGGDDDIITISGSNNATIQGGSGGDIITSNGTNNAIDGGDGGDVITITTDNNSANVTGGGDDDIISVSGTGNSNIHGGTGNDTLIQNSLVTDVSEFEYNSLTSNTGEFVLNAGETTTITLDGKNYTFTPNETQTVKYDLSNDIANFEIKNSTITTSDDTDYQIKIKGTNNTINLKNGQDSLIVEGNENSITAVENNKNIQINGDNNSFDGGSGANIVLVNGSSNTITGGNNDDIVTVETGSDNNITTQNGNDIVTINSANNNINTGNDDDIIYMDSINDDTHTIDAGAGNDIIKISTSNSTGLISGGSGNDNIFIDGSENSNIQTGSNDDNIFDLGNNNNIINNSGNDIYYAKGQNSTITGIDKVVLNNKNGSFVVTEANKEIDVVSGSNVYKITTSDADTLINYMKTDDKLKFTCDKVKLITPQEAIEKIEMEGSENDITLSDSKDSSLRVIGDSNNITTNDGNYDVTISGNNNTTTLGSGTAYIEIEKDSENSIIYGNNDTTTTVLNSGKDTEIHNCDTMIREADKISIQAGITSDSSSKIELSTGIVLGRMNFDVSTQKYAAASVEKCEDLIEKITKKMTEIGAQHNRLSSAEIAAQIQKDNKTSTLSTYRDADIAEVSSEFVNNLVLQNASNVLSITSSNIHTENVMRLLLSTKTK